LRRRAHKERGSDWKRGGYILASRAVGRLVSLWKSEHDMVDLFESLALSSSPRNIFLLTLAGSNLFDAVVAFAFLGLFLLMLFHRMLWPLVQRPVYAIARGGLVRYRKVLLTLGAVLLALGVSSGPVMRASMLIKRVAEALLGS